MNQVRSRGKSHSGAAAVPPLSASPAAMVASGPHTGDNIMMSSFAERPCALPAGGPAVLTEDELAAVAGGFYIPPESPPFSSGRREHEAVAPPGGYTP
jgi:hypothetical protein